jgi:hypothetical protein
VILFEFAPLVVILQTATPSQNEKKKKKKRKRKALKYNRMKPNPLQSN